MPYTRREFLEASAALGAVLGVDLRHWNPGVTNPWGHPVVQEPVQDLVVLNARVYTIDDALPRAEAFAV